MRNTLDTKIKVRKIQGVNSTAQTGDPLVYVTRDTNLFDVMNDYGHRLPTGVGPYRTMGVKELAGKLQDSPIWHRLSRIQLEVPQFESPGLTHECCRFCAKHCG